jgi:UDPglucose 6-dehydrogenase
MIADMCDHLPGADAALVTNAIGADSRIGRKYLKPATGYGGPCFPRDNKAFAALGRRLGVDCTLAEATDQINDRQVVRLRQAVETHARAGDVVAVLGMSYKPATCVVEESQGVALASELCRAGYKVVVSDPQALPDARKALPQNVICEQDAALAIAAADVVVIATPWPQFSELSPAAFARSGRRRVVIDPWRLASMEAIAAVADIVTMGVGAWRFARERKIGKLA